MRDFCEKWLADGIGNEYMEWKAPIMGRKSQDKILSDKIFIESATGTGKTTFILNKLFPYASKKGYNILYLSNRTALKEQLTKDATKEYEDYIIEDDKRFTDIKIKGNSGRLTVINYQSLLIFLKEIETKRDPLAPIGGRLYRDELFYDYIVYDEVHFFLEDSLFNTHTNVIFQKTRERFWNKVEIFMSATISEFIGCLEFFPLAGIENFVNRRYNMYRNTYNKNEYSVVLYQSNKELVDKIKNSELEEHWLIFVPSKQEGYTLAGDIKGEGCSATFISSISKKTKTWKQLTNNSKFEEKVLISTTVIDNGINIKDSRVKNVVIPFCYRVEFLQMLGRLRTENRENIKIYTKYPTIQKIKTHKKKLDEMSGMYNRVYMCMNSQDDSEKLKLLMEIWPLDKVYLHKLFCFDPGKNVIMNSFARIQLNILINFYREFEECKNIAERYIVFLKQWLNNDSLDIKYIYSEGYNELDEYLMPYIKEGKNIYSKDELEIFYKGFMPLYNKYCAEVFETNPYELKKALSIRKEKARRKATINEALRILRLHTELIKKQNVWQFKVDKEALKADLEYKD